MSNSRCLHRASVVSLTAVLTISAGGVTHVSAQTSQDVGRPMTFLDVRQFSSPGAWAPSPDGRWMLYTISTPDWQEDARQSDIHLVSMEDGVVSSRQLTFTSEKDETSPKWSRDGSFFVFASNRDAETGRDTNRGGGGNAATGDLRRGGGAVVAALLTPPFRPGDLDSDVVGVVHIDIVLTDPKIPV